MSICTFTYQVLSACSSIHTSNRKQSLQSTYSQKPLFLYFVDHVKCTIFLNNYPLKSIFQYFKKTFLYLCLFLFLYSSVCFVVISYRYSMNKFHHMFSGKWAAISHHHQLLFFFLPFAGLTCVATQTTLCKRK